MLTFCGQIDEQLDGQKDNDKTKCPQSFDAGDIKANNMSDFKVAFKGMF